MKRALLSTVLIVMGVAASFAQGVFFQDGSTDWTIHLSAQADDTEVHAAQELRDALKKISGADFGLVTNGPVPETHAIVVGSLTHPDVRARAAALHLTPGEIEQVAVYTLDDNLYLAGNQPRGALYAVYSFLQRELGVRWLWPGPDGEFMPARTEWKLPKLAFNHTPVIPYRGFHLCGDWRDHEMFRRWMARNFINIHRHGARRGEEGLGLYSMWSSHNARLKDKALFEQHPEYFAEIDGVRYRENICLSNPDVDKLVAEDMSEYIRKHPGLDILSIFPSDNQTYCRCARCATRGVSTCWFEFFNRVTDLLKKEFPHLKFATIAYQGYRDVPSCAIRNCEFVEYASYSRCNVHPYGTPGCEANRKTLAGIQAWKATGLPIGNYAYEYDIFSRNRRFVPFLSMIDNAIKTSRDLGLVTMIPEIILSPKTGPVTYVGNVQNRLSIYLYARLLWDPGQDMDEVLRDWCRTAFATAADPMFAYYTHMDRAWTSMPIHAGILGDAMRVVDVLFAGDLQQEATAKLTAAEQAVSRIGDPVARERAAAAVQREVVLFKQWLDLLRMKDPDMPRLNLPLLEKEADLSGNPCRPRVLESVTPDAQTYPTEVRTAWTRDALLVRWTCADPRIDALRTHAARRDGDVVEDDSVEVMVNSGIDDRTARFAVNAAGVTQDARDSQNGVADVGWNPEWKATTRVGDKQWEAEMSIPFSSLGEPPNPNETWEARFVRHNGGREDFATAAFPAKGRALLFFSSAPRTDRALLWWCGAPERELNRAPALRQEFTEAGWHFDHLTNGTELLSLHRQYDAYWFRHPNGPNKVPEDYWRTQLVPAVKNGAVAVFVSYWNIPLDEYFDDPTFKVQVVSCSRIPLAARRSVLIAPGEWSTTPNNLLPGLQHRITPAYGFVPADPDAWTILATAPRNETETFPYLLTRRYGKGRIFLCGDRIPISASQMLENFLEVHERESR